jgi:hypothetical protein
MSFLFALAAFAAAIVIGVVLFLTDHVLLGVVALLAAIPCALAAWIWRSDQM